MAFLSLAKIARRLRGTGKQDRRSFMERRRLKQALRRCSQPLPSKPRPHRLPGELIVSLTSYPPRFEVLPLTIKSLLQQTVAPDRLILWVAHDDLARLPASVRAMEGDRFSVRTCDDLRSFKKILPTLAAFPDAFIVTADDDTYYPPNWLAGLVRSYDPREPSLVCHRAHRLRFGAAGQLAPYLDWTRDVSDRTTRKPGVNLFPTGVGGVLYPPGSLPPETLDLALIEQLSPTCDDSWLFFMTRLAGWKVRRAPGKTPLLVWPRSQAEALRRLNRGGRKDEMLADLARHFGGLQIGA